MREVDLLLVAARAASNHSNDLWDHLARAFHYHLGALQQFLGLDVVLVVQRRLLHVGAADIDRLQHGVWIDGAGAPNVEAHVQQPRRCLLGGELVGDRPARLASHVAQMPLVVEPVHLYDQAITTVVQRFEHRQRLFIPGDHVAEVGEVFVVLGVHLEAQTRQVIQRLPLRIRQISALVVADGIGEYVKRTPRRHRRVYLSERSGGGVARVDVCGQPLSLTRGVEFLELGLWEIDLSAHLQHVRQVSRVAHKPQRDALDSTQVGGNVFADRAVAARRASREYPALVGERYRQPVVLQLAHHLERVRLEHLQRSRVPRL